MDAYRFALANKLLQENDASAAYNIYISLGTDFDVDAIISRNEALMNEKAKREEIAKLFAIGTVVTYGRYEQDNDLTNGSEPIEWQVLALQ